MTQTVSGRVLDGSWVESLGGPLIVVPVSVLAKWGGCSENWGEEPGILEDYDRACAVEGWAGLLDVSRSGARALVACG